MKLCITVDGASGTGKSVLSKRLAKKLQGVHYSTGFLYRVLGALSLRYATQELSFLMDHVQEAIDPEILKKEETADQASVLAADPWVRESVIACQKKEIYKLQAKGLTVVLDGRDAGSVVWPSAEGKFFLKAEADVCLQRRVKELGGDKETVAAMMSRRDKRDSARATGPLIVPEGAVEIDVSYLTEEEVFAVAWQRLSKTLQGLSKNGMMC